MSKTVTIPADGTNPFVVVHNGVKYTYKPGATVTVSDGVALEIEEYKRWRSKYFPEEPAQIHVQPDLSQNDPNAADYVKNRTHYVESQEIVFEYEFGGSGLLDDFPVFEIGDAVTVNVDGVEYSLVAFDDEGYVSIGDAYADIESGAGQLGWQLYVKDGAVHFTSSFTSSETHTITFKNEIVHKLDKKFLPDDVASIVYIVDKSGDGTVYSCSVDFITARAKRFSVPVCVKIIEGQYAVYEAFKVYTNGGDSIVDVTYKYERLGQEYSDSFVHDANGVYFVEPQ